MIYAVGDDKSNLKDLYTKVKKTRNSDFIYSFEQGLIGYFVVDSIDALENMIDKYD